MARCLQAPGQGLAHDLLVQARSDQLADHVKPDRHSGVAAPMPTATRWQRPSASRGGSHRATNATSLSAGADLVEADAEPLRTPNWKAREGEHAGLRQRRIIGPTGKSAAAISGLCRRSRDSRAWRPASPPPAPFRLPGSALTSEPPIEARARVAAWPTNRHDLGEQGQAEPARWGGVATAHCGVVAPMGRRGFGAHKGEIGNAGNVDKKRRTERAASPSAAPRSVRRQ